MTTLPRITAFAQHEAGYFTGSVDGVKVHNRYGAWATEPREKNGPFRHVPYEAACRLQTLVKAARKAASA